MLEVNRAKLLNDLESMTLGLSVRDSEGDQACFTFKDGVIYTYNDVVMCRHRTELDITGTIRAAPFLKLISKYTKDQIEISLIEVEDRSEIIIKEGSKRKSGLMLGNEINIPFKSIEKPGEWKPLDENFHTAIQLVCQTASKSATEDTYSKVHITKKWLESCNSVQSSRYTIKTPIHKGILVSADVLSGLYPLGVNRISVTDHWVHFKNDRGLIISLLCQPDHEWDSLDGIFDVSGRKLRFPMSLVKAIDKAEIFTEEKETSEVSVRINKKMIQLRGDGYTGWFEERSKMEGYSGEEVEFFIAPKLLSSIIAHDSDCYFEAIGGGYRLTVHRGSFAYTTSLNSQVDTSDEYEEKA